MPRFSSIMGVLLSGACTPQPLVDASDPTELCGSHHHPCRVGEGAYYAFAPTDPAETMPMLVFVHGWRDHPLDYATHDEFLTPLLDAGYLVVLPMGEELSWEPTNSHMFTERDDMGFLNDVVDDALARWPIDPARVALSGFSLGGSMTWDMACMSGDRFAAFAPVSGTFWDPLARACPSGPLRMLHTHGRNDGVMPIEGRCFGEGSCQSPVMSGVAFWVEHNGCANSAESYTLDGPVECQRWLDCDNDAELTYCEHDGTHRMHPDYATHTLDFLSRAGVH